MHTNSHEIDYQIIGDSIQLVEVELDPGETVIAEAGAMMYMTDWCAWFQHLTQLPRPTFGVFFCPALPKMSGRRRGF